MKDKRKLGRGRFQRYVIRALLRIDERLDKIEEKIEDCCKESEEEVPEEECRHKVEISCAEGDDSSKTCYVNYPPVVHRGCKIEFVAVNTSVDIDLDSAFVNASPGVKTIQAGNSLETKIKDTAPVTDLSVLYPLFELDIKCNDCSATTPPDTPGMIVKP